VAVEPKKQPAAKPKNEAKKVDKNRGFIEKNGHKEAPLIWHGFCKNSNKQKTQYKYETF